MLRYQTLSWEEKSRKGIEDLRFQETFIPVLYTNKGQESEEAKLALQNAKIAFQEMSVRDRREEENSVPQLLASEGTFSTLADINWYARVYGDADEEAQTL